MHKVVRKDEVEVRKVNDQKYAYRYINKEDNPEISLARVEGDNYKGEITLKQTMLYYVIEGEVTLKFKDETITLEKDDTCMIDAGETYEMSGTFKVLSICNPAFEV